MSPLGRAYLDKLYDSLGTLPEEERIDAVREIESHIVDGIRNGQAEGAILAKLGDPKKLAKAYRSTYMMQKKPRTFKEILNMAGFLYRRFVERHCRPRTWIYRLRLRF